jgi:hypothetical protein
MCALSVVFMPRKLNKKKVGGKNLSSFHNNENNKNQIVFGIFYHICHY